MFNEGDLGSDPPLPTDAAELKKEHGKLRAAVTRAYNCSRDGDPFDYNKVNRAYKRLKEVELVLFEDGIPEKEEKKVEEYTQKMITIREAIGIIKPPKAATAPKIQLARESVPEFDGTFQEWILFKGSFMRLIDTNPDLDDDDKARHLIRACTGEARKLITPYASEPDAYKRMMDALRDHYENSDRIKENIIREIQQLPFISSELDPKVQDFKNQALIIVKHVQQYFGIERDFHTRVISEFLRRWEQNLRQRSIKHIKTPQDVIKVLQKFHDEREGNIRYGFLPSDISSDTTASVAIVTPTNGSQSSNPASQVCAFCGEQHFTSTCKTTMDPADRKSRARQHNLCYNCLRSGHGVRACPSNRTCRECQQKHHTLLHQSSTTNGTATGASNTAALAPAQQALNSTAQPSMATAVVCSSEQKVAGIVKCTNENPIRMEPIISATVKARMRKFYWTPEDDRRLSPAHTHRLIRSSEDPRCSSMESVASSNQTN